MANIFSKSVPPNVIAAIRAKDTIAGQAAEEFKAAAEKDAPQQVNWVNDQGQPVEWQNDKGETVAFVSQPKAETEIVAPPVPPAPVPSGWMNTGDDGLAAHHIAADARRRRVIDTTTGVNLPPLPLTMAHSAAVAAATGIATVSSGSLANSAFDTGTFDKATFDGVATFSADAVVVRAEFNVRHQEMLARIARIERVLQRIPTIPAGIGHNQPPEPIETLSLGTSELAQIRILLVELKSRPALPADAAKIREAETTLRKISNYILRKVDVFIDQCMKTAAIGLMTAPLWWHYLGIELDKLANAIQSWLAALPPMP